MDLKDANVACRPDVTVADRVTTKCGQCRHGVILHCGDCQIQVTGCHCTRRERAQAEELAKQELWTPQKGWK